MIPQALSGNACRFLPSTMDKRLWTKVVCLQGGTISTEIGYVLLAMHKRDSEGTSSKQSGPAVPVVLKIKNVFVKRKTRTEACGLKQAYSIAIMQLGGLQELASNWDHVKHLRVLFHKAPSMATNVLFQDYSLVCRTGSLYSVVLVHVVSYSWFNFPGNLILWETNMNSQTLSR